MLNCDETIDRLYAYLDRELTAEELVEVQRHLEACPPCQHRFAFEENVLRLVGECARNLAAPPELVEKVRRLCQR